ncbi:TPA: hypothetical protein U2K68_000778 [Providencia stuartii]|nr:hypothetical protein [Providencia stuartii]HEM7165165.1 hypothetical protein [Providencia stuartii]
MPLNRAYYAIKIAAIAKQLRHAGLINHTLNLPIIYLPGILGSQLYDRQKKTLIWGDYRSLIRQNHYQYTDSAAHIGVQQLHSFSVIPGLIENLITAPLKQLLEKALGYRDGIDLFFLAYDWRADHRHLAAQLDAKINQVKQRYGEQQKILLIAHSSSNCAIRYYLQQSATQKNRDSIAKWYAFGPPWVGTFQSLALIQSGYYPAGKLFHGFSADDIASCPSAYQLLPSSPQVIDKKGNLVEEFDIYDEECWKSFSLGPYRSPTANISASTEHLREELANNLMSAKAFSQCVSIRHAAEQSVSQTWFLSDNHQTVKCAVYDQGQLFLNAKAIQKHYPNLVEQALTKGDDHLPIDGLLKGWEHPILCETETPPLGENYVFINQARTHRGLVGHIPNLRTLAFDIATLNQKAC